MIVWLPLRFGFGSVSGAAKMAARVGLARRLRVPGIAVGGLCPDPLARKAPRVLKARLAHRGHQAPLGLGVLRAPPALLAAPALLGRMENLERLAQLALKVNVAQQALKARRVSKAHPVKTARTEPRALEARQVPPVKPGHKARKAHRARKVSVEKKANGETRQKGRPSRCRGLRRCNLARMCGVSMDLSDPITPSDLSKGTKSEATYMRLGSFAFFEVSMYNNSGRRIFEGYEHQKASVYIPGPTPSQLKDIEVQPGETPPKTILYPAGKPVVNNFGSSFTGYGFTGPAGHFTDSQLVKITPIIAAYGMQFGWELFNAKTGDRLQVWEVGQYLTFSGVASIRYAYPSSLQD